MNNLYLRVSFLAGTSLQAAYDDAEKLRKKLDCFIEFNFNGARMVCYGQSFAEFDREYEEEIKAGEKCQKKSARTG